MVRRILLSCVVALIPLGAAHGQGTPPTSEQLAFFEKNIRPVLAANCYQCHSAQAEKIKGKLVLDSREGIRKGGESGPAVVPGNVKDSLLIQALKYHDESLKMPPKGKLTDAVIADFEQWVKMGAPDPRDGPAAKVAWPEIDIKKGKQFWAFQPPKKAGLPMVEDKAWPRGPIDQFLLAAMENQNVKPVGDADRAILLRRIYLDLIGLPPTPPEIEAFVKDKSDDAFAKVVDRLLESPHFGERWGRHWLDVARYGETSGKQVNFNYPYAWRYRDWVINAFNADLPYNQFVKQQIAGDLMSAADPKQKAGQLVATGFLALGPKDHNERNRVQFTMDTVDEQIEAMGQAFLGLTISCARCHDHKFDPIPQKDYYALAGIFKSTQPLYGTIRIIQNNYPTELITLSSESGQAYFGDKLSASQRETMTKQLEKLREDQKEQFKNPKGANPNQLVFLNIRIGTLEGQLNSYDSQGNPKQLAMGVREAAVTGPGGGFGPGGGKGPPKGPGFGGPGAGFTVGDCPLYERGEVDKPKAKVKRGLPQVLVSQQPTVTKGSGRLELAQWLASRDNPLTARVMVNRVWLHLFGRGLVATPDNFGAAGQAPSNPQLLDYLAVSFMEDDAWSVKKLIRRMVLSRAYQLAPSLDKRNYEIDPDNVLVWRMSKRRLDAEVLRDSILAVAGTLDRTPLNGSSVGKAGEGYSNQFGQKGPGNLNFNHRAVYIPIVRTAVNDMLALFDFPDPSLVTGQRGTTTVPAQALFFLNNPWVINQANAAAGDLLAKKGGDREWIQEAYLKFFARPATDNEIQAAETFLKQYAQTGGGKQLPPAQRQRQAWTALCQAMFGSAEFLYRS